MAFYGSNDVPYPLRHAMAQCQADYGDVVSIDQKKKALTKFGRFATLGTSTTTVQEHGGTETLLTDNLIDVVVSSDAGDTQTVTIEGHTIAGSNLTFVTQTATLNGTTNVALDTPLARATRIYNIGATDFAGTVKVVDATAPTVIYVQAGGAYNQSQKAATSISSGDYWFIDQLFGAVEKKTSAVVDFSLEVATYGGVYRQARGFTASQSAPALIELNQPIIIRPNSSVRMRATGSTTDIEVVAFIGGYLGQIMNA
jgi:hypothetical protein